MQAIGQRLIIPQLIPATETVIYTAQTGTYVTITFCNNKNNDVSARTVTFWHVVSGGATGGDNELDEITILPNTRVSPRAIVGLKMNDGDQLIAIADAAGQVNIDLGGVVTTL